MDTLAEERITHYHHSPPPDGEGAPSSSDSPTEGQTATSTQSESRFYSLTLPGADGKPFQILIFTRPDLLPMTIRAIAGDEQARPFLGLCEQIQSASTPPDSLSTGPRRSP
jgi:hypothetical protein